MVDLDSQSQKMATPFLKREGPKCGSLNPERLGPGGGLNRGLATFSNRAPKPSIDDGTQGGLPANGPDPPKGALEKKGIKGSGVQHAGLGAKD